MSFDINRLNHLLEKYKNRSITYEEHQELFEYINNDESRPYVLSFMDNQYKSLNPDADVHEMDWDNIYKNSKAGISSDSKSRFLNFFKIAAAIICVLAISYTSFKIINKNKAEDLEIVNKTFKNDVLPGGNKAVLILANGEKIDLSAQTNGLLAKQGNVVIKKNKDGQLVYDLSKTTSTDQNAFNTIETPRGGTYQVILPDGSNVWLNASSSIKFPVTFKNNERRVELLTGEAYFEITKNKEKPFYVNSKNGEIRVLGTHFNVMCYPNEKHTEITLAEGSIEYTNGKYKNKLVPGQKLLSNNLNNNIVLTNANLEETLAWKNGLFVFNNTNLDKIMRAISRWYDVDYTYENGLTKPSFTGVIPKQANVSKVLKLIEDASNVKFGIKNKLITCSKKD